MPHNLLTGGLQKGLRLVYKGREIVGEGTGFGVPVLLYSDDTYFSGSSWMSFSKEGSLHIISKEFIIDRVQRRKFIKPIIRNSMLRKILRYLDRFYQSHRHLQTMAPVDILGKLGVRLEFMATEPIGSVVMTYSIMKSRIDVKADFRMARRKALKKIFVLNEQGSHFFRRYLSSDGMELTDRHIGAWDKVESRSARIMDIENVLGFELRNRENSVLHRGRESIPGLADWVGLDYEVDPKNKSFEYDIDILGV